MDCRSMVLRVAYVILVLSLLGLYLLSNPVTPGPADIHVDDAYVISLVPVTALSHAPENGFLAGNYTGHQWPGNIPTDEPAQIHIAADNPRLMLIRICSHEVRHWELEQDGVPTVDHHPVMEAEGTQYGYPWNWNPDCFRIIPHILY